MRLSAKPFAAVALLASLLAVCAGCLPSAPAPVAPTPVTPATMAPPTAAATVAATPSAGSTKLPAGVDADGNFYRGDPKAPVKLVDFSDFQ